ncbi:STAS domain-containing protein [Streptomyces virginiae]|uniref:STAS domain-containing protein n=1 Tax=Streptomyces virginiae TaxID=1961 RepID=UPI00368882CB
MPLRGGGVPGPGLLDRVATDRRALLSRGLRAEREGSDPTRTAHHATAPPHPRYAPHRAPAPRRRPARRRARGVEDALAESESERQTDHTRIEVRGELDLDTIHVLAEALTAAAGPVVIDLHRVTFADCTLVHALLGALPPPRTHPHRPRPDPGAPAPRRHRHSPPLHLLPSRLTESARPWEQRRKVTSWIPRCRGVRSGSGRGTWRFCSSPS